MGGDHKCPVCQATFTRPQHVARHMRSREYSPSTLLHFPRRRTTDTGDRPYKCQYCGDQFARRCVCVDCIECWADRASSDLLSRHINKCHANEKPLPSQGARRKGSASASRATTSKQACDQCVQASLPCDGSNPCGLSSSLFLATASIQLVQLNVSSESVAARTSNSTAKQPP